MELRAILYDIDRCSSLSVIFKCLIKCAQYTEHLSTKYVWNPNQILQHQITYTTMARLRWHQSLHHNQHLNAIVLKVKSLHRFANNLHNLQTSGFEDV